jgi:hypothetical protein
MAKNLIQFFATKDDILPVTGWVESQRRIKYVRTGLFEDQKTAVYRRADDLPNLGIATSESAIGGDCYLVADADLTINIRKVPQVVGGVRYAVDQFQNPQTVAFQAGGFWAEEILLYGRVGTASDDTGSIGLYRLFASAIRKHFVRAGAYYVGPAAKQCAIQGCRLTIGAQSPREFDLSIDRLLGEKVN